MTGGSLLGGGGERRISMNYDHAGEWECDRRNFMNYDHAEGGGGGRQGDLHKL